MKRLTLILAFLAASCAPVRFSTEAEKARAADDMRLRLGMMPLARTLGYIQFPSFVEFPEADDGESDYKPLFQEPQTVLLLSFDGFRWDYRNRGITPEMDALAHEGVSALSLRPVFPTLTFSNHYAIITGQYPQHHGIIGNTFVNPASGVWFKVAKDSLKKQAEFYTGEALWETARKYGIRTASHSYPASDINDVSRQPDYLVPFNPAIPLKDRIDTILAWLALPVAKRPRFICAYIETVDAAGHETGTTSERTNTAIRQADSLVGRLRSGIKALGRSNINLIICSDHGMTDVSPDRTFNLPSFLPDVPHRTFGSGELMQFESAEKTDEANTTLYHTLRERESHFRVYRKENIPAWYGSLRHAFVLPIVAIAENGWLLDDGTFAALFEKYPHLGKHGWDADWTEMQGIFLAEGTAFKRGYTTGTLRNIDIAPLVCALLGIPVPEKSDGDIRKIGFFINKPHAKP